MTTFESTCELAVISGRATVKVEFVGMIIYISGSNQSPVFPIDAPAPVSIKPNVELRSAVDSRSHHIVSAIRKPPV